MIAAYIKALLTALDTRDDMQGNVNGIAPYSALYDVLLGTHATANNLAKYVEWPPYVVRAVLEKLIHCGLACSRNSVCDESVDVYEAIPEDKLEVDRVEAATLIVQQHIALLVANAAYAKQYLQKD